MEYVRSIENWFKTKFIKVFTNSPCHLQFKNRGSAQKVEVPEIKIMRPT